MLADKIIQERKKKGWSQEELAERLDVSRQSVSKWEGGLSVPELDKILAMSELFGVSTDYLLKNEQTETAATQADTAEEKPRRKVTYREAETYVSLVKRLSWRIAFGVMLCILSPITLIQLCAFADAGFLGEGLAVGLGVIVMILFIGAALALFIPAGIQLDPYEFLEKEAFDADAATLKMAKDGQAAYAHTYRTLITVGIVLFPVGVAPLIVTACLDLWVVWIVACVNLLLALVAIGVFMIVRACYVNGAYQKLLQAGEFSVQNKVKNALSEAVMSVYWCVVTALYLLISFLTGAWGITWVIWMVAGVISPVLEALLRNGRKRKEN